MQQSVPVYLQRNDSHGESSSHIPLKQKEYLEQMNEKIRMEKDLNDRKRMYNREVGRTAVVDKVCKKNRILSLSLFCNNI